MNFFERQRQARTDSRRLLFLFALAILGIVLAIDLIALLALDINAPPGRRGGGLGQMAARHAPMLIAVSVATLAVIGITSLIRTVQLRSGGDAIARSLGGTPVPAQSLDLRHQRLRNVVEEVAIASGVPVPEIYVLEHEPGINAFAAGFSTADAAIAVTRGALEQLDRDELQGVIAHEFSHVLNGDMRLNLRLIGWLAGITVLAVGGRLLMRARGRNAGGIVLFGGLVVIIGWIGLFCARMIKAGISRKREYLADASAVQFTRQTQGIAGALKKIAAGSHGSRLTATDAEEASHLLFGDGVGYSRLFATHPPLEERIRALEPGFKLADLTTWMRGRARADSAAAAAEARRAPLPDLEFTRVIGEAAKPIPAPIVIAGLPAAAVAVRPEQVIGQVANPASDDFATAELLHAHFPPELDAAAHAPERAQPLLAGLLMSAEPEVRGRQSFAIGQALGAEASVRAAAYAHAAAALHPMQRLPLAEVAFAALRRLPAVEMQRLRELAGTLIAADGRVSLFEFCLGFLLRQQIDEALAPGRAHTGRRSLKDVEAEIGVLLSLLAREGQAERTAAERAFAAGVAEFGPAVTPRFSVPEDWTARLGPALARLDGLKPAGKSQLIAAMTRTVMHDNRLEVAESELLRTACAALHCPLPPLLHENG